MRIWTETAAAAWLMVSIWRGEAPQGAPLRKSECYRLARGGGGSRVCGAGRVFVGQRAAGDAVVTLL